MIAIFIQARMGSERLPGKVLLPLGDRPVLSWVIRAAVESGVTPLVAVATTEGRADDPIEQLANEENVRCVRGPEEDVLQRFLQGATEVGADTIIRLTGDCPLLDPRVIRMMARAFTGADLDYLSTINPRSLPRGLDVEIVTVEALRRSADSASPSDRAHVTSYIYRHPETFLLGNLSFSPSAADLRVTLDTPADYELLEHLARRLPDRPPSWREIVEILNGDTQLRRINAHVSQKRVDEG